MGLTAPILGHRDRTEWPLIESIFIQVYVKSHEKGEQRPCIARAYKKYLIGFPFFLRITTRPHLLVVNLLHTTFDLPHVNQFRINEVKLITSGLNNFMINANCPTFLS